MSKVCLRNILVFKIKANSIQRGREKVTATFTLYLTEEANWLHSSSIHPPFKRKEQQLLMVGEATLRLWFKEAENCTENTEVCPLKVFLQEAVYVKWVLVETSFILPGKVWRKSKCILLKCVEICLNLKDQIWKIYISTYWMCTSSAVSKTSTVVLVNLRHKHTLMKQLGFLKKTTTKNQTKTPSQKDSQVTRSWWIAGHGFGRKVKVRVRAVEKGLPALTVRVVGL